MGNRKSLLVHMLYLTKLLKRHIQSSGTALTRTSMCQAVGCAFCVVVTTSTKGPGASFDTTLHNNRNDKEMPQNPPSDRLAH